jgi:aspartyl-tRNA(Asn)/glutamyl-tRNA(Gln) amidotransferase subunit A
MSQFVRDPGNITAIQSDFASGASDPVALVEEMLQRADEIQPHVQAWLSLDANEALRQARACRDEMQQGLLRGPLHGIPVAVKDVIDIAGQQTRAGSRSRAQCSPARINADVVSMLRAAGAVILGKAHTTEYAYFEGPPPTRNPWNVAHTPGGSSAGSAAAVASGMAVCSIGTQTAGSVVRPAAYCGIAAFKPTTQDLSTYGMVALAPTFDTVGWFGYRMRDVAAISMGLQPQRFKHTRSDHALRIAIMSDPLFSDASEDVTASIKNVETRLRSAGHEVIAAPSPVDLSGCLTLHQTVLDYELSHIHGALEAAPDLISAAWLAAIVRGKAIAEVDYFKARHQLLQIQSRFWDAFANINVLVAPAAPDTAPEGMRTGDPRYIIPFTALGGPIATVPVGLARSGLPLGVMLCCRPGSDAALFGDALQMADAIEMPRIQHAYGLPS